MSFPEYIVRFITGPEFTFLRRLVAICITFAVTVFIAQIFKSFMKSKFNQMRKVHLEHPELHYDPTKNVFLRRFVTLLIYLLGFGVIVYIIPEFRSFSYSIFVGAGVFAVIMGFAAQKVFANMIAGISIASSEPIRVGDRVTIDNNYGVVEDITLRHVMIRTWDNNRVILPNSVVNDAEIVNHSLSEKNLIQTVEIGISYDSDIETAKKIIIETVRAHKDFMGETHEFTKYVDPTLGVSVRVVECGDSSVKLRAYFIVRDRSLGSLMSFDVLEDVKKRFENEGILIPFPQRVISYKTDVDKELARIRHDVHKAYRPKVKSAVKKKSAKRTKKKK